MKRAFGLMSAIIILLLIATLMSVVVKVAFVSVKHTSDTYMTQRAQLFMKSAIENTILAVEGYERNSTNKCLKNIEFTDEDGRFKADVEILKYYCYDKNDCPCDSDIVEYITTPKSHGYFLMKVTVESNLSNPRNDGKIIKIEKTTLQRP